MGRYHDSLRVNIPDSEIAVVDSGQFQEGANHQSGGGICQDSLCKKTVIL